MKLMNINTHKGHLLFQARQAESTTHPSQWLGDI